MAPLQNSSIERPERLYEIDMVVFGNVDRQAMPRTIRVLAQTAQGARRICKARYRRCEIRSAHAIMDVPVATSLDLFDIADTAPAAF